MRLPPLMQRSEGSPDVRVGLIDGPVNLTHPDLVSSRLLALDHAAGAMCSKHSSFACVHGTFIAGILASSRTSAASAICPGCTVLVRPIFSEGSAVPVATPGQLAGAIAECIEAGAHVVNLSASLEAASRQDAAELEAVLDRAAAADVVVVAAAGNESIVGGSVITRHPWVIPVVAYDAAGRPLALSNLGRSMGRRGLGAPGHGITSIDVPGPRQTFDGTSAATPFVTGTVALLKSLFPASRGAQVRQAMIADHAARRSSVVPPLLDAWGAYERLSRSRAH